MSHALSAMPLHHEASVSTQTQAPHDVQIGQCMFSGQTHTLPAYISSHSLPADLFSPRLPGPCSKVKGELSSHCKPAVARNRSVILTWASYLLVKAD
jgi:hypothetical protein